jgi:hypothetical protein
MNTDLDFKDSLSLNLFSGSNSPPANPVGYNGSPLAAFKMDNPEICQELIEAAESYLEYGKTYYQCGWNPVESAIEDFIETHKYQDCSQEGEILSV